jgi:hypothetical protein
VDGGEIVFSHHKSGRYTRFQTVSINAPQNAKLNVGTRHSTEQQTDFVVFANK